MKTSCEKDRRSLSKLDKEAAGSRLRRGIMLALLVVAVVLAMVTGGEYTQPEGKETPPPVTAAPTLPPPELSARQLREQAYEKDLSKLEQLLQDDTIKEETRQQAALQLTRMIEQHQLELGVEEALSAAGYVPCLVLMQNDALTVAVSASEVTAAQSAAILSICLAHTQVAAENIRIMPGVD